MLFVLVTSEALQAQTDKGTDICISVEREEYWYVGYITPKILYFYFQYTCVQDQCIQKAS